MKEQNVFVQFFFYICIKQADTNEYLQNDIDSFKILDDKERKMKSKENKVQTHNKLQINEEYQNLKKCYFLFRIKRNREKNEEKRRSRLFFFSFVEGSFNYKQKSQEFTKHNTSQEQFEESDVIDFINFGSTLFSIS